MLSVGNMPISSCTNVSFSVSFCPSCCIESLLGSDSTIDEVVYDGESAMLYDASCSICVLSSSPSCSVSNIFFQHFRTLRRNDPKANPK